MPTTLEPERMRAIEAVRRVRQLKRLMPLKDAINFVVLEGRPGILQFNLIDLGRPVALRGSSSDIGSFNQIFLHRDIDGPTPSSPPRFIIDAGANVGMSTLFYATEFPTAQIVAIEPEPENFAMLKRNCAGLPNIKCIQAALWGTEGQTLNLKNPGAGSWGYRTEAGADGDLVPTVSIDGIMRESGFDRADIVKIDVEGAECDVFANAPNWLDRVSILAVELHDRFKPGCARTFYTALGSRNFTQTIRGESLFLDLRAA